MNQDVTQYIEKTQPWQIEVCTTLRNLLFEAIPSVEERLQYGKPHYLKNGSYAAVIYASKDKVSFMVFNAAGVPEEKGFLRALGNGDRKVVEITEGQEVDYERLAELARQTSSKIQDK